MEEQFDFSTLGVAEWQIALVQAPPAIRRQEAALAASGLNNFVPTRFLLTQQQLAYLAGLDPDLDALWSTQLAYAINQGIPIELIKPETGTGNLRNTKYIEEESNTGTRTRGSRIAASGYFLRFTIGY